MNKLLLNIKMAIAFTIALYAADYILLRDNGMHMSIAYIVSHIHQWANVKRLFVVGMLPIYIAMVIFGSSVISLYLASTLRQLLVRSTYKK